MFTGKVTRHKHITPLANHSRRQGEKSFFQYNVTLLGKGWGEGEKAMSSRRVKRIG